MARLELVTTLRELGVSLGNVRRVLGGQVTAAEVAAIHLEALDTEIRYLRLRRAVVAAVVKRSADSEEMGMINKLARLSAAERRQIIDDFTAEVFRGLDPARRCLRAGPRRRIAGRCFGRAGRGLGRSG